MSKHYGVFNTKTDVLYPFSDGTVLSPTPDRAKILARRLNADFKPEHQHFTVVTVIFDPEV